TNVTVMLNSGGDAPTPAAVSLASVSAAAGAVELVWHAPGAAASAARVERRDERESWRVIGAPVENGADRLAYRDVAVESGRRYAYRLLLDDGTLGAETW